MKITKRLGEKFEGWQVGYAIDEYGETVPVAIPPATDKYPQPCPISEGGYFILQGGRQRMVENGRWTRPRKMT